MIIMRRYIMINNDFNLEKIMLPENIEGAKKMNIKGRIQNMDVYRIPIEMLYYNDQNDRIATWISKYEAENGDIKKLDIEEYNNTIQEYIIKSDKQRFTATMNNIRNFSQLEAGVVFIDGRVIDGNRRFTCLRKLYKETGDPKFAYFNAVILNGQIDEKVIKLMELTLQHGQEGKVDYNPIEKLVGVYRDIIKNKLLDVKEYAKSIDSKESEVEKSVQLATLMEEFLEYINAPEQFYIARELEIDGPLQEIYNIKRKIGADEDKWEKAKITLFDNMLMKTSNGESGDITRSIREFNKRVIANDDIFEEYYEKHEPLSRKLHQKIEESGDMLDTAYIRRELRDNEELKESINKIFTDTLYTAKKNDARKAPIEMMKQINDDIARID